MAYYITYNIDIVPTGRQAVRLTACREIQLTNDRVALAECGPRRARTPTHAGRLARDYPPEVQLSTISLGFS